MYKKNKSDQVFCTTIGHLIAHSAQLPVRGSTSINPYAQQPLYRLIVSLFSPLKYGQKSSKKYFTIIEHVYIAVCYTTAICESGLVWSGDASW